VLPGFVKHISHEGCLELKSQHSLYPGKTLHLSQVGFLGLIKQHA
jgi:hypothetical protein